MLVFLVGEMLSASLTAAPLLTACSQNMLPLFLLSNLMTGAVNMSINSLLVPNAFARIIVSVYMFLVCWSANLLYTRGIHLTSFMKIAQGAKPFGSIAKVNI